MRAPADREVSVAVVLSRDRDESVSRPIAQRVARDTIVTLMKRAVNRVTRFMRRLFFLDPSISGNDVGTICLGADRAASVVSLFKLIEQRC